MRVISGTARSLRLEVPVGTDVRPTIDRYRETVFNILGQQIVGGKFLDIFAGTGANGIEALSRGGDHSWFVETSREAGQCIENNLRFTKLFEKATLLKYDYDNALSNFQLEGQKFDTIYLDPPFEQGLEQPTIQGIIDRDLLDDYGLIVCESSVKEDFSWLDDVEGYGIYKEKIYKNCKFTFIEKT